MQPLKDRLAASHDAATLAKAPLVASRIQSRKRSADDWPYHCGTNTVEKGHHQEVEVSYLLAHICKLNTLVDESTICQGKNVQPGFFLPGPIVAWDHRPEPNWRVGQMVHLRQDEQDWHDKIRDFSLNAIFLNSRSLAPRFRLGSLRFCFFSPTGLKHSSPGQSKALPWILNRAQRPLP